jgi:hypothetical protein
MNSYITFTQRPENGIGNRMRKRVRIRVTLSTTVGCDVNTTEHELAPFNQPMRISTNPNPKH